MRMVREKQRVRVVCILKVAQRMRDWQQQHSSSNSHASVRDGRQH
jgi:hypothetical protein